MTQLQPSPIFRRLLLAFCLSLNSACSDFAAAVREITYPPDFKYVSGQELRSDMQRLAFELRASEFEVSRQLLFVDDLRRQIDDLDIKSPVDGIVGDLLVDQKSAVSRDTPVMAVVDLSRFEIDALIPESYADDLAIGMQTEILVGGERYSGQLIAVSPEIVNNQVASRIRFNGDGPTNLRQNQRLTTRILLAEYQDVIMVQRGQFLDGVGLLQIA